MKRGLILFGLLLIAAASPRLAGAWRRNQAALETQAACLWGANPEMDGIADHAYSIWFGAIQAACRDQGEEEQEYWRQWVTSTDERLGVVQAAAPEGLELAALAAINHPENAEAQFWIGKIFEQQGKTQEAIQAYARGLAYEPRNAEAWLALGRLYRAQDNPDAAVSAFDHACENIDLGKNGCLNAGRIYLEQNRYSLAVERFRFTLVQLGGDYWPASLGLARALKGMGQVAEAIEVVRPYAQRGVPEAQQVLEELSSFNQLSE